ncbi:MAG: HdeD family acid-resistance protein [Massilia sp.]
MDNFFVRSWWVMALRGILGIAFAVLTLMWPGLTLLTLVALFAAYALMGGIASIAGAIRHRRTDDDWWLPLLLGVVSIGAAIVALMNPALTTLLLVLVIGANALVTGVLDIVAAIRLRKAIRGEWMLALSGLASVAFGAIVFFYPGAGAVALVWLVSAYAFVTGVLLLALSLRVRTLARGGKQLAHGERRSMPDRRIAPAH